MALEWCESCLNETDCDNCNQGCYWVRGLCNGGSDWCSSSNDADSCRDKNCFWYDGNCHCDPSTNPSGFTTAEECTDAGCYWYNDGCHATANPESDFLTFEDCDLNRCYWYDGACHQAVNPSSGNEDHMYFICPKYDSATNALYFIFTQYVIPYAQDKEWTILQSLSYSATNDIVHPIMREYDPKGLFEGGHGSNWAISGQNGSMLWWAQWHKRMTEMRGKIVYLYSCYTGAWLGPWMVSEWKALSYLGFDDEAWIGTSQHYKECAGEPWIALIDGDKISEAYQRTIDKYNYWIQYLLDNGQTSSASHLIHNRDHFVTFGNQNAKLITGNKIIDDTETFTINVQQ